MQTLQAFTPKEQARGFIVPNFIQEDENLCIGAKYLYGVLCDYARDKSFCYPSKKTLAKQLKCSLNSIRNWIKELIRYGFIKSFFNGIKDVFYLYCPVNKQMNNYKNSCNNGHKNFSAEGANFAQGCADFEPETNLKETKLVNPQPPQENNSQPVKLKKTGGGNFLEINKGFEEVWSYYPKKEAKESARSMWFRLVRQDKLPSMEVLKNSIAYFYSTFQWQKKCGQYIPQMVNFLRGLRWEDWIEEQQKTDQTQKPATQFPKLENLEERKRRTEQENLEKEREQARARKLDEAWGKFEKYFIRDNSFQRFVSKCVFIEQFNQGNVLEVTEKQNITVYEYFRLKNIINSK